MKSFTPRTLIMTVAVVLGLVALAACTRSANPTTLPPATKGATTGAPDSELATMNAVSTKVAQDTTATARPGQGQAGGSENTPVAPAASATPAAGDTAQAPATNTAIPPVATNATATPIPVGVSCANPYTVKDGDWIYKIARDCKVDPTAIIAINPGINPDRIVPGQKLNMPAAGATAVPPATSQAKACSGTYTVKSGDNLFRLAYNCGLTTEQLAAVNAIPYPYTIYVGDVIKFP